MGSSFKVGRAFGIDVKVHWTFFLLLIFFAFLGYRFEQSLAGALVSVTVIVALFVCVLLHEFGHSLVAKRLGIDVPDITLLPIGGVARLKTLPQKPMDEVKIAIAGPLVNVVLAPIFLGVGVLLGYEPLTPANPLLGRVDSVGEVFVYLGAINVALVVFNLLPAFPMDGGRVLRGLLATRLGAVQATDVSAAIGQGFAFVFFLLGLLGGNLILALIAVFIFFGAGGEAQMVRQRELTRGLSVSDVMGKRPRLEPVSPYHTFGQVLDSILHGYQEDFPVVEEDGRLVGMLTRQEIFSAARSPDRLRNVRDLMLTDFPTVSPGADLFGEGSRPLQESGLRAIPVVEGGELVGMLTVDDVGRAGLLRDLHGQRV
jgi:Zn-dependent protease/CBS domain-containing protein